MRPAQSFESWHSTLLGYVRLLVQHRDNALATDTKGWWVVIFVAGGESVHNQANPRDYREHQRLLSQPAASARAPS
jgi:hypothetical protein